MVDLPDEGLPCDFGKYRLEKRIATGGMAEIFLAHRRDAPMDPLVIKRILPHLSKSGEFVSMFLDEARVASNLRHNNVVAVEDVGQIDGAYYIAMEYVHGEDIRRIYNRAYKLQRSLPLSHSIRVIADAALGLGYAHKLSDDLTGEALGLVHRDVSPQNILVTYEGDAKVVDFGIAKAANKVAQTRAGVLKGKYSYMSPEQALGDAIDHRTDIFALGIILYETTTGTRLFKRHNELATLQAIIKCEFVPPSDALPNYPPELEDVLLKALTKDPEDRYDDAEEFSAALYDFLYSSGLYVERDAIAEFMSDLFSDRLEEEKDSGQVALPGPDEVREEMRDSTTPMRSAVARSRSEDEEEEASAPPREAAPEAEAPLRDDDEPEAREPPRTIPDPSGFADDDAPDAGATAPEADLSDIAHKAYITPNIVDPAEDGPRRKRTDVVRPDRMDTHTPEPEETVKPTPDEAPTVAAHPSYQPPVASSARLGEVPDTVIPPEMPSGPRKPVEHTEQIRRQRPPVDARDPTKPIGKTKPRPPPEETHDEWPPVDDVERRRSLLIGVVLGAAVVVAVLTGVLVSRLLLPIDPETPAPPDRIAVETVGQLTVLTEPGAEVHTGGEILGRADEGGSAGPFEVPAGQILVRVANPSVGFERTRALEITAGKAYEVEIRARHGWLRLAVAPWARVSVDGKDLGLTPLPKLMLTEGVHELVLENPDIKRRYEATVRIQADQDAEVRIDLEDVGERM